MNTWLAFIIGVLVGLLIFWLIDLLFLRPRRAAAEADLRLKLENANKDAAAFKAQIAGQKHLQARLDGTNGELDSLKAELAGLTGVQARLDACQAEAEQHKLEIERLNADLAAAQASSAAVALAAGETRGLEVETVVPDDLTVIEGIGPVISALLNKSGIYTFAQLAGTSAESLRSILDAGGPRFRIADPGTWSAQALLARDGYLDTLKALQGTLRAGRRA
jgi:predicted flap endonuclease-1-like 5' DNA nuclease